MMLWKEAQGFPFFVLFYFYSFHSFIFAKGYLTKVLHVLESSLHLEDTTAAKDHVTHFSEEAHNTKLFGNIQYWLLFQKL